MLSDVGMLRTRVIWSIEAILEKISKDDSSLSLSKTKKQRERERWRGRGRGKGEKEKEKGAHLRTVSEQSCGGLRK